MHMRRAFVTAAAACLAASALTGAGDHVIASPDDGPPQRIEFDPGTDHGSVDGAVAAGATDRYVFGAAAGQYATISVSADTANVVLTVFTPGGSALSLPGVTSWEGSLPADGDYGLEVAATGGATGRYSVRLRIISIATSAPDPTNGAVPAPPSEPIVNLDVAVVAMVDVGVTPCDAAHQGMTGYDANATTFFCGDHWWPDEFEGGIEYVDDDRFPLGLGQSGPHVQFVQNLLSALDYDVGESGADGYFGIATYHSVVRWQIDTRRAVTAKVTVQDMEAMRAQVGGTSPVQLPFGAIALANAEIPSLCGHPAGRLVDGQLPSELTAPGAVGLGAAFAEGDVDGDGVSEIAASFYCNAGGVGWPEQVVVFRSDRSAIGVYDLAETPLSDFNIWRLFDRPRHRTR